MEAERLLAATIDEVGDAFVLLDRSWRIAYLNATAERWLQCEREDAIGLSLWRSFRGVAGTELERPLREAMQERVPRQVELYDPHARRWLQVVADPTFDGLLLRVRDASSERSGVRRLERDVERYRLLAETLTEIVWATDADGRWLYLNRRWYEFSGDDDGHLDPAGFLPAVHPKDRKRLVKAWATARLEERPFQVECRLLSRPLDAYRWFLVKGAPVRRASGGIAEWVGSASDIDDRRRAERAVRVSNAQLQRLAHHDTLTDLPNRSLFESRLERVAQESVRSDRAFCVLFIDLDGFKAVNDDHGHAAGDRVLQEVARRLRRVVREDDLLARLHGDEFGVLLPDVGEQDDAARIAHALVASLTRPLDLGGQLVTVTASVGVSLFPDDARDARGLLRCADVAMYRAKASGKNTVRFFSDDLWAMAVDRVSLAEQLAAAMARGELTLRLQPQWDTRTGGIAAFEALLRWASPTLGAVAPTRFVPLAEERGELRSCLDWSFEESCLQLKRLGQGRTRPLQLGYNVRSRQLLRTSFRSQVETAIDAGTLEPERLELELAADGPFDDMVRLRSVLEGLRARGVRVALDRIDVGGALLAPLVELPFDLVKLGPRLIARATEDDRALDGAHSLVALAHAQGAEVVAVGVETEAQWRVMSELGCSRLQGFLLGAPTGPERALALLRQRTELALF